METHSRTNGHPKKTARRSARSIGSAAEATTKTVHRAKRKATSVAHKVDDRASKLIKATAGRISRAAGDSMSWVNENPKTASGVLIGSGVLVGFLTLTRAGRQALRGFGGRVTGAVRHLF